MEKLLIGSGPTPQGEVYTLTKPDIDGGWSARQPLSAEKLGTFLQQFEASGSHLSWSDVGAFVLRWPAVAEWPYRPDHCWSDVEAIQVNFAALLKRFALRAPPKSVTLSHQALLCDVPLAFVDVETTGLKSQQKGSALADKIIEIAIHVVQPDGSEEKFATLVNPGRKITNTEFHPIRDKDVKGAPAFDKIAPTIFKLLAAPVFISHQTNDLDLHFIKAELLKAGIDWMPTVKFNTCRLAQALFPEYPNHKLQSLAAFLRLPVQEQHRAESDVITMRELWKALLLKIHQQHSQPTLGDVIAAH